MMATRPLAAPRLADARTFLVAERRALVPGSVVVALMVYWAIDNGGYDSDTWYWGALVVLALLAVSLTASARRRRPPLSRSARIAIGALAAYVAWSFLSIAWAQSPGDALQGSDRALLYLLVFALMLSLPWSGTSALVALIGYTLAIGTVALVILLRLASEDRVTDLVVGGRLAAPTGYFNASVALFSMSAGLAVLLASRRELPGLLRGILIGVASLSLQLALVGQSRGWLFTLPLVIVVIAVAARDRLRVAATAVLPAITAVIPIHRLIGVFSGTVNFDLSHAAGQAGRAALMFSAGAFVFGTLLAWAESLTRPRTLARRHQQMLGSAVVAAVIVAGAAGAFAATHGDPFGFISRQWHGFSHTPTSQPTTSNFATVGSGRYDFWRVSLDAVLAHPIGGLGQDNFDDYYITRRRTSEEPSWTHSLEMRLLAHTGFVGFLLFLVFVVAALWAAVGLRRRAGPVAAAAAGTALVPLTVWLIHGSVDWFWEFPALSGPALGFLAMAVAIRERSGPDAAAEPVIPAHPRRRVPAGVGVAAGTLALLACVFVLGFPYLSVRETALASDARTRNPASALRDLARASSLNPLSAVPGRVAGTIALESGRFTVAEQRFRQSIDREPGGWYAWFGDGLAASALGDNVRATRDYRRAASINSQNSAVKTALARVNGTHPVTPSEGLSMLVIVR